jgi:hypothetical protein
MTFTMTVEAQMPLPAQYGGNLLITAFERTNHSDVMKWSMLPEAGDIVDGILLPVVGQ